SPKRRSVRVSESVMLTGQHSPNSACTNKKVSAYLTSGGAARPCSGSTRIRRTSRSNVSRIRNSGSRRSAISRTPRRRSS
ncbi:hypothetical protein DN582_30745, partial [Burkholderia multivorans]